MAVDLSCGGCGVSCGVSCGVGCCVSCSVSCGVGCGVGCDSTHLTCHNHFSLVSHE